MKCFSSKRNIFILFPYTISSWYRATISHNKITIPIFWDLNPSVGLPYHLDEPKLMHSSGWQLWSRAQSVSRLIRLLLPWIPVSARPKPKPKPKPKPMAACKSPRWLVATVGGQTAARRLRRVDRHAPVSSDLSWWIAVFSRRLPNAKCEKRTAAPSIGTRTGLGAPRSGLG